MPLDAFIDETITLLGDGAEEVVVASARRQRDNVGPSEQPMVDLMNGDLFAFLRTAA